MGRQLDSATVMRALVIVRALGVTACGACSYTDRTIFVADAGAKLSQSDAPEVSMANNDVAAPQDVPDSRATDIEDATGPAEMGIVATDRPDAGPAEMDIAATDRPDAGLSDTQDDAGADVPFDETDGAADRAPVAKDIGQDVASDVLADVAMDVGVDTGPSCTGSMCPCVPGNPTGWCDPGESCSGAGCASGTVAGSLLITEILYNPLQVDDVTGEWFEIHNPSATTAISLARVRVTSENDSLSVVLPTGLQVIVPPRGYVVFARSPVASQNGWLPSVAYAYGANLTLGNSSDFLQLDLQPSATLIHRVTYNNAMGWPRGPGRSMSLQPTAYNATASALATSWCDAAMTTQWTMMSDYGTPGAINVCP